MSVEFQKKILYYPKEMIKRINDHYIESFSSQIAFFMLLSIFPYLIILFMILTNMSLSYSEEMTTIYRMMPDEVATIIKDYLEYSAEITGSGVLSPLVIISIWISSNAMTALMKALNMAYNVTETRKYIHRKLISVVCTLMTIILITIALLIPNIGVIFMTYIRKYLIIPEINIEFINFVKNVISITVFIFILGLLYYILPNKKFKVSSVIPGTIFSFFGLLFISYLFSYFVKEYSRYSLLYGGLAAVIILLMWLFLCGIILMIGGEINSMKLEKRKKK